MVTLTKLCKKFKKPFNLLIFIKIPRNVFAAAIDALGTENGFDFIIQSITDTAKVHKRRGISKQNFVDLRSVVVEVVSEVSRLDDEGKQAWNDLFFFFFHVIFTVLDEAKKIHKK